jgi:hypothetical protein
LDSRYPDETGLWGDFHVSCHRCRLIAEIGKEQPNPRLKVADHINIDVSGVSSLGSRLNRIRGLRKRWKKEKEKSSETLR